MKKLLIIPILFLSGTVVFGQSGKNRKEERKDRINALMRQEEEGVLIYNKQTIFGVQVRSTGYGAFLELGRMQNRNVTNLYQLEFSEIKHPKEDKTQLPNGGSYLVANNPLIYGKQNYFYTFKLGYGQSRRIGDKGNKNGVSVQALYMGGISAGLLRPYYITIVENGETKDIRYAGSSAADSSDFIDRSKILSGTGLGKGWGDIKFQPGIYAKTGLRFDYGRFNEVVSSIEVGVAGEFYTKKVPIMVLAENKQFFLSAYLAIEFGKRK